MKIPIYNIDRIPHKLFRWTKYEGHTGWKWLDGMSERRDFGEMESLEPLVKM